MEPLSTYLDTSLLDRIMINTPGKATYSIPYKYPDTNSSSVWPTSAMPNAANKSGILSAIIFRLSPISGLNIMVIILPYTLSTARKMTSSSQLDLISFLNSVAFMILLPPLRKNA